MYTVYTCIIVHTVTYLNVNSLSHSIVQCYFGMYVNYNV